MARELLGNGQAITGLLGMLTSWEEPVRLAAVRALAKVCWQVRLRRSKYYCCASIPTVIPHEQQ